MYLKISLEPDFTSEGVAAFRIKFENDLAEEDVDLSEEVEDVLISTSYFDKLDINGPISKALDLLTENCYKLSVDILESYIYADEEYKKFDDLEEPMDL